MSPSVPPPGMPDPVAGEPPPPPASRNARGKLVASGVGAVVLAGIAFAVFGGSASRVVDPVAQAATVSAGAAGYQMHMSMETAASATSTPITATGEGTFDLRDHAGSMSLTMSLGNDPQASQTLGSSTLKMQEIIHGTTVYVKVPAAAASVLPSAGKQWISIDLAKLTGIPGLSSLADNPVSGNPSDMLQYLRAASDSIVSEGKQEVDGLLTTHYRAEMNLDRAVDSVSSAERAAAQQAMTKLEQLTHIQDIPVDVWVDAHHLVRRIEMNLASSTVNERITMDISHYGPEPLPPLPPASDVANLNALLSSGG